MLTDFLISHEHMYIQTYVLLTHFIFINTLTYKLKYKTAQFSSLKNIYNLGENLSIDYIGSPYIVLVERSFSTSQHKIIR